MSLLTLRRIFIGAVLASFVSGASLLCLAQQPSPVSKRAPVRKVLTGKATDTPETLLGERLFLETRFAEYFATHFDGDVNHPLAVGDPLVAQVKNPQAGVSYTSAFAGRSINCRSCHFVDEYSSLIAGVNRTYADFQQRTPIPERGDGQTVTIRNSRNMVDALLPNHSDLLLHGDGEFLNPISLVEGTLTGRDFGWLPNEQSKAIQHIAKVIREDNGQDELGQQYGGSYARLMLGTAGDIPERSRLAAALRIDVATVSDRQVVNEAARLITAYINSLRLEHTPEGIHSGSAYDMFLAKNGLPAAPDPGETDVQYSQRLLREVEKLDKPRFVMPYERWLRFHPHVAEFGQPELNGLKIFLRQGAQSQAYSSDRTSPFFLLAGLPLFGVLFAWRRGKHVSATGWSVAVLSSVLLCMIIAMPMNSPATALAASASLHTGSCASCHPAPEFTDFRFHNNGTAQDEFDGLHGAGSFAKVHIPAYSERARHPEQYLPATAQHPHATGVFRAVPAESHPLATDLGLWNIFGNPDFPEVQSQIGRLICGTRPCEPRRELPSTIALFRTPGLRDLGHSWPYLHTGRIATLEGMVHFYIRMSALSKAGQLRNGDVELTRISLDEDDVASLVAFLRSLDEDYDN